MFPELFSLFALVLAEGVHRGEHGAVVGTLSFERGNSGLEFGQTGQTSEGYYSGSADVTETIEVILSIWSLTKLLVDQASEFATHH